MAEPDSIRYRVARTWQPVSSFISALVVFYGALGALLKPFGKALPFSGTGWIVAFVVAGVLFWAGIRFPRVAVAVNWLLIGHFRYRGSVPSHFRGPRPYLKGERLPQRERDTEACWRDIQEHPFLLVEGESGCGKSSLVQAGLVPLAERNYRVVMIRRYTGESLRCLLGSLVGERARDDAQLSLDDVTQALAERPPSSNHASDSEGRSLLVVLDQFEEIFAQAPAAARRDLLTLVRNAIRDRRARVVLVIRSDYLDLLLQACRDVDPAQVWLTLPRFRRVEAFGRAQAEAVLKEILDPGEDSDNITRQQIGDFAHRLAGELLRPPRDKRLFPESETVLPVDLQVVGAVLEGMGERSFVASNIARLGGKAGLFRQYVKETTRAVWLGSGLGEAQSLLVLRELVSATGARRERSAAEIAMSLSVAELDVRRALEVLAERYVVRKLPPSPSSDHDAASSPRYELMHDHLAAVLSEAPDSVLQRDRDARERLAYWRERFERRISQGQVHLAARVLAAFSQLIPIVEVSRLWRYARSDDKPILLSSIRAFALKSSILLLMAIGGTAILRSDWYQTRIILGQAQRDAAMAGVEPSAVWLEGLVALRRGREAADAARRIRGPMRASELARVAGWLAALRETEPALDTLRLSAQEWGARKLDLSATDFGQYEFKLPALAFEEIAAATTDSATARKLIEIASLFKSHQSTVLAYAAMCKGFIATNRMELADEAFQAAVRAVRQFPPGERTTALVILGDVLTEARATNWALDAFREARDDAQQLADDVRSEGLLIVAGRLARAHKLDDAAAALKTSLSGFGGTTFPPLAGKRLQHTAEEFARLGETELLVNLAHSTTRFSREVREAFARGLVVGGAPSSGASLAAESADLTFLIDVADEMVRVGAVEAAAPLVRRTADEAAERFWESGEACRLPVLLFRIGDEPGANAALKRVDALPAASRCHIEPHGLLAAEIARSGRLVQAQKVIAELPAASERALAVSTAIHALADPGMGKATGRLEATEFKREAITAAALLSGLDDGSVNVLAHYQVIFAPIERGLTLPIASNARISYNVFHAGVRNDVAAAVAALMLVDAREEARIELDRFRKAWDGEPVSSEAALLLCWAKRPDLAFQVARADYPDSATRSRIFGAIAAAFADRGDLSQAEDIIRAIPLYEDDRSHVLSAMAQAQARAHRYRVARQVADTCSLPWDRLDGYGAILFEYAKERRPVTARTLAHFDRPTADE